VINTVSQFSPLLVLIVGYYYRHIWDKGTRAIFYLYLVAVLFEITNELFIPGMLIYHLWTPIEVGFLLYIYSQWSNLKYKMIFMIYLVIWIMLRAVGLESIQGLSMDTLSLVFASLIFIFIPIYVFDVVKSYQKVFMLIMSIYFGGCLVFILTANALENKALAWELHSFFNIIAAVGTTAVFIIRNNEIVCGNSSLINNSLPSVRET